MEIVLEQLFDIAEELLVLHRSTVLSRKFETLKHMKPDIDMLMEQRIRRLLHNCLGPELTVVGEETTALGVLPDRFSDCVAFLDPIDGTRLLLEKQRDYAISIAFAVKGKLACGIVALPSDGDCYVMTADRRAYKNRQDVTALVRSMDWTFAPARVAVRSRDYAEPSRVLAALETHGFGVERLGSTARRLIEVSEKRISGVAKLVGFENGIPRLWGLAAGLLACDVAGLPVRYDPRARILAIGSPRFLKGLMHSGRLALQETSQPELWNDLWALGSPVFPSYHNSRFAPRTHRLGQL